MGGFYRATLVTKTGVGVVIVTTKWGLKLTKFSPLPPSTYDCGLSNSTPSQPSYSCRYTFTCSSVEVGRVLPVKFG
jgi:hypothetical protein